MDRSRAHCVRSGIEWLSALALLACADAAQQRRRDALLTTWRPRVAESAPAPAEAPLWPAAEPLRRGPLIAAVLARNPSLEAARDAVRAVLAAHPRETALEDPMLEYELAPLSLFGGPSVGQSVRVSQRLPWPGRRAALGERVLAEAEAMASEAHALRTALAASASRLFDAVWTAERALAIVDEHARLLEASALAAREALAGNRARSQDVLGLELERAQLERERLGRVTDRAVAVAALNALLRRAPGAVIPAAADDGVAVPEAPGAAVVGPRTGAPERAELQAQRQKLRALHAELEAAELERMPSFVLMASYETMWMDPEHRLMLGLGVELPLQQGARGAAADVARAQIHGAEREAEALADELARQVVEAEQRTREAESALALFEQKLVPTARARLDATRTAFAAGEGTVQEVLVSERELRGLELEQVEARAAVSERRAELAQALGVLPVSLGFEEVAP